MYEESARVPMLLRAPGHVLPTLVHTPVSLVDVGPTLLDWFGLATPQTWPGCSLAELATRPDSPARAVFSEYHAAGAATGAFMLRQGSWKLIHYEGMAPQLFNLVDDPQELSDLGTLPEHAATVDRLMQALRAIADPNAVDAQAKADQRQLVDRHGGREAVVARGGFGATPAPGVAPVFA